MAKTLVLRKSDDRDTAIQLLAFYIAHEQHVKPVKHDDPTLKYLSGEFFKRFHPEMNQTRRYAVLRIFVDDMYYWYIDQLRRKHSLGAYFGQALDMCLMDRGIRR